MVEVGPEDAAHNHYKMGVDFEHPEADWYTLNVVEVEEGAVATAWMSYS